jgi:hypothetical protein
MNKSGGGEVGTDANLGLVGIVVMGFHWSFLWASILDSHRMPSAATKASE